MFGNNPVRKPSDFVKGLYRVQEIFSTIQGEGPFTGIPAVFVRLAGCNLRCSFCDTDFESNWNNVFTTDELVQRIKDVGDGEELVVLTGGEPFLQHLSGLIRALRNAGGPHVQIETAGTVWDPGMDAEGLSYTDQVNRTVFYTPGGPDYSIVVSPKTPKIHKEIERRAIAWKYIIDKSMADLDDLPPDVAHPPISVPSHHIYLQPMDEPRFAGMSAANQRATINLCRTLGYRFSLQVHKAVEMP